jgi:hypothetical protein
LAKQRDLASPESGPTTHVSAPFAESRVNRRQFLGGAAASSLGVAILRHDADLSTQLREIAATLDHPHSIGVQPAGPTLSFSVAREADLCLLDFTFYGFTLVKGTKHPSIVATTKKVSTNWIGVVVQFPPQSIGEASYESPQSPTSNPPFDPVPVLSQVAAPSRLAFTFATGDKVPLPTGDAVDLLNWTAWQLSVSPSMLAGSGVVDPESPTSWQCAIEAPLDLTLSPVAYPSGAANNSYFTNRTSPLVSPNLVVDCWTTSLAATYREPIIVVNETKWTRPRIEKFGLPESVTPVIGAVMSDDYNSTSLTPEGQIVYNYLPPPPK